MSELADQLWGMYYPNPQIEMRQEIREPYSEPRRKHKKRRIQKKWLKRFGSIRRWKIYTRPLDNIKNINCFCEFIIVEYTNYPVHRQYTILDFETRFSIFQTDLYNTSPAAIRPKRKTYNLPSVGATQKIDVDLLRCFANDPQIILREFSANIMREAFYFFVEEIEKQHFNYGNQSS